MIWAKWSSTVLAPLSLLTAIYLQTAPDLSLLPRPLFLFLPPLSMSLRPPARPLRQVRLFIIFGYSLSLNKLPDRIPLSSSHLPCLLFIVLVALCSPDPSGLFTCISGGLVATNITLLPGTIAFNPNSPQLEPSPPSQNPHPS